MCSLLKSEKRLGHLLHQTPLTLNVKILFKHNIVNLMAFSKLQCQCIGDITFMFIFNGRFETKNSFDQLDTILYNIN